MASSTTLFHPPIPHISSRSKPTHFSLSSSLSTKPLSSLTRPTSTLFSPLLRSTHNPPKPTLTTPYSNSEDNEPTLEEPTPDSAAVATVDAEPEPEQKPLRNPIIKLGDIMGILNRRAIDDFQNNRPVPVPDLRTGDIVEIKWTKPTKRRRYSIYKGIVMSKQNAGIHTTIRVRRMIAGIGVEIVFPVYSPNVIELKVVKHRKVRRARLYYLRDKLPRFSTFK